MAFEVNWTEAALAELEGILWERGHQMYDHFVDVNKMVGGLENA